MKFFYYFMYCRFTMLTVIHYLVVKMCTAVTLLQNTKLQLSDTSYGFAFRHTHMVTMCKYSMHTGIQLATYCHCRHYLCSLQVFCNFYMFVVLYLCYSQLRSYHHHFHNSYSVQFIKHLLVTHKRNICSIFITYVRSQLIIMLI